MSNITAEVARLVATCQPDDIAREQARMGVLDFFAVAFPVVNGTLPDATREKIRAIWPGDDAQSRALRLGYCGHALDFDDFHPDFRGHPGTVILPTLLALGTQTPQHLLDAFVVGVEMAGRLGLAVGGRHYVQGFHNTSTLGVIAAAAAGARLVGATEAQTATALAIAATQSAGLRVQFGSDIKPLHAGFAARAAVTAVQLAQHGIKASISGALESFLAAYSPDTHQPQKLTQDWGTPWRIVTPGLEFKPWPTCSGTHGAALAALRLRKQWLATGKTSDNLIGSIEHIEIAFPPGGDVAAFVRQPVTGVEARFSLEYVIAECLLHGELALTRFDARPVDPVTAQLAARVTRTPDASVPPDAQNPSARFHRLTLQLHNGEQLISQVTRQGLLAQGVDVDEKLRQCLPGADATTRTRWQQQTRLQTAEDLEAIRGLLLG
mgnify:CR=1 FL=1